MGPFETQVEANFTEASRYANPKVGDRVMYAKSFLRSIFAGPTDKMWFARGVVTKLEKLGSDKKLAVVDWDKIPGESFPPKIITTNLNKVGTNEG